MKNSNDDTPKNFQQHQTFSMSNEFGYQLDSSKNNDMIMEETGLPGVRRNISSCITTNFSKKIESFKNNANETKSNCSFDIKTKNITFKVETNSGENNNKDIRADEYLEEYTNEGSEIILKEEINKSDISERDSSNHDLLDDIAKDVDVEDITICFKDTIYDTHKFKNNNVSDYIPIDRDCKEIFFEDKNVADNYYDIADLDDDITVKHSSMDVECYKSWDQCNFDARLIKNIIKCGYVGPRKIQAFVMPLIKKGLDVKAQSETGTGKTAAYLLPIINEMLVKGYPKESMCPYAVIIAPVRELALQIHEQARKFCENLDIYCGRLYGQTEQSHSIRILEEGCDILICTPGRLKSFLRCLILNLKNVKYIVYDEADRLLETDFKRDMIPVATFINECNNVERITLFFSSTFSDELNEFVDKNLKKGYVKIVNSNYNEVNKKISHNIIDVTGKNRNKVLLNMLLKEYDESLKTFSKIRKTLIFVHRKDFAHMLTLFLIGQGIKAQTINGDYAQKYREEALLEFRRGKIDVLVATDIFARGFDVKNLDHVINVNLPSNFNIFINRVGRTGRIKDGVATSFYDRYEDYHFKNKLIEILRESSSEVPEFLL
uniref:RNA helicase n=1 Tax=Parastrongyloides trichosuri TaxID=131310 RepID=A0A0N4ZUA8_PARTI